MKNQISRFQANRHPFIRAPFPCLVAQLLPIEISPASSQQQMDVEQPEQPPSLKKKLGKILLPVDQGEERTVFQQVNTEHQKAVFFIEYRDA